MTQNFLALKIKIFEQIRRVTILENKGLVWHKISTNLRNSRKQSCDKKKSKCRQNEVQHCTDRFKFLRLIWYARQLLSVVVRTLQRSNYPQKIKQYGKYIDEGFDKFATFVSCGFPRWFHSRIRRRRSDVSDCKVIHAEIFKAIANTAEIIWSRGEST